MILTLAIWWLFPNLLGAAGPEPGKEGFVRVTAIDFDECEPVLLRSKIMEVSLQRGTLVVAEREVREMDVTSDGRRIKTGYIGLEGKPESRGSFRVGQYVLVKGVQHPDGFIAAFEVQKIDKPVDKKQRYQPIEPGRKPFQKTLGNRNDP
jgi:hypothetical protein